MSKTVDGWERREIPVRPGSLWCETIFTKGGVQHMIKVDRINVDRYGPEWRRREENRLLRDPHAEPDRFVGGAIPGEQAMSEMVERAARKLFIASWGGPLTPPIWEMLELNTQIHFQNCVRIVIEAMREPTEEMVEAARVYGEYGKIACNQIWGDMIDEALR